MLYICVVDPCVFWIMGRIKYTNSALSFVPLPVLDIRYTCEVLVHISAVRWLLSIKKNVISVVECNFLIKKKRQREQIFWHHVDAGYICAGLYAMVWRTDPAGYANEKFLPEQSGVSDRRNGGIGPDFHRKVD